MISYVNGLMFNQSTERDFVRIVAIEKNRPDWQKGKLNGVGGKIEQGETPEYAMKREFWEETGIWHEDWTPFLHIYRKDEYEVFYFIAFDDDSCYSASTQTDEEIIRPYVDDILNNTLGLFPCVDNLKWILPMALDNNIRSGKFIEIEDVSVN